MSKVVFPQIGKEIEAAEGQTILDAALDQGIDYPHSCRQGRCGACKSMLLRGTASMKRPYSRFALSEDELKNGMILACKAVPVGRAEVAWPASDSDAFGLTSLAAEVVRLQMVTQDIVRLFLRPERGLSYRPGQYALLKFGANERRSYSMAGLPEDELLEFHVRHVPNGQVSSYVRNELRVGDTVEITGPLGSAFLRETATPRIVAIAGGSGLAPMQAIVRRALEAGLSPDVRLYHGVRGERDVYHERFFLDLASTHSGFRYCPVLSAEAGPTSRRTGLVGNAVVADNAVDESTTVYVAGPKVMVEALNSVLKKIGVVGGRIHADAFE